MLALVTENQNLYSSWIGVGKERLLLIAACDYQENDKDTQQAFDLNGKGFHDFGSKGNSGLYSAILNR